MKAVKRTFERLYEDGITDEWDRVILVIGDEGVGKSTFMTTCTILWHDILGRPVDPDTVLDQVVWGRRSGFKQALSERPSQSIIPVQDAARALHNLEVQVGEQRELQKDLLDIRVKNFVILLGFQSWDDIPRFMKKRRAKNAFVIPRRGYVRGYNREALDEKYETDEWPDPQLRASFPPLDGLDVWAEFQRRDEDAKMERIEAAEDPDPIDIKKNESMKVAFRAVKPWTDEDGMSYRDAAKLIDFSRTWIGDRVDEWEDGYHRDLLTDEELEAAARAAAG